MRAGSSNNGKLDYRNKSGSNNCSCDINNNVGVTLVGTNIVYVAIGKAVYPYLSSQPVIDSPVDEPIDPFVGRRELLDKISVALQTGSSSPHWSGRMVALVGFGGVGKTELARKFAYDHREDYLPMWINAETEESTHSKVS